MKKLNLLKQVKWTALLLSFGIFLYSCNEEMDNSAILDNDALMEHPDNGKIIPGQYIVTLNPEAISERVKMARDYTEKQVLMAEETNLMLSELSLNKTERVYSESIYGFVVNTDEMGLINLRNDKRVLRVEPDRIIALAPPCGTPKGGPCPPPDNGDGDNGGGDGGTSTQVTPYGIARVNGGVTYTGNRKAWVIDSGIQLNHEDLNVDAANGFTAFTSGQDANFDDKNGHGTHVAGTIAAIDNNVGVIGVAAGATVVPIKVLDRRGSGSISGVIAGVDHVTARAASGDVANMSLGGGANTALDDAVKALGNKGVRVAIAAGNSSTHAGNSSPARATGTNLYAISAMNSSDNWASFSNYGNPPIRFCAPGVSINSTWINNGYRSISGTSMAAPHVAGILLLGNIRTDGTVNGDPDGNPDPIAVR